MKCKLYKLYNLFNLPFRNMGDLKWQWGKFLDNNELAFF